jgi:hypothetical protein
MRKPDGVEFYQVTDRGLTGEPRKLVYAGRSVAQVRTYLIRFYSALAKHAPDSADFPYTQRSIRTIISSIEPAGPWEQVIADIEDDGEWEEDLRSAIAHSRYPLLLGARRLPANAGPAGRDPRS